MNIYSRLDMGADGAIVCTDDAIAMDNTELVLDRDCHEGITWRGLAWCGSPGVARHSPSVVLMLGPVSHVTLRQTFYMCRNKNCCVVTKTFSFTMWKLSQNMCRSLIRQAGRRTGKRRYLSPRQQSCRQSLKRSNGNYWTKFGGLIFAETMKS